MNELNEPYKYPPTDTTIIDSSFFPESMSNFEVNILTRVINNWITGKSTIIKDESGFSMFNIIPYVFVYLKETFNIPPILVVTNKTSKKRWIEQIINITKKTPLVINQENFKKQNNDFDFALVKNPKNMKFIQNLKWGFVVLDCYSCDKSEDFMNIFQMVKDLDYFNVALISGNVELKKEGLDFLKLEDNDDTCISITEKDVIDSAFISEKICLCDFSEKQRNLTQSLFFSNKKRLEQAQKTPNERFQMFFQEIVHQTKLFSVLSPKNEGKFKKFSEIINKEKEENRKILIICENLEILKEIHSSVDKYIGSYFLIDNTLRKKRLSKTTIKINSINEHCIILTSLEFNYLEDVLNYINFDSILAFDLSFNPLKYVQSIVNWLKRTPNPIILRLITVESIEQILFNIFWKERDLKIYTQFSLEECNTILMKSADLIIQDNNNENNDFIINYSNHFIKYLFEENFEESKNFWEDYFVKYELKQKEKIKELNKKKYQEEEEYEEERKSKQKKKQSEEIKSRKNENEEQKVPKEDLENQAKPRKSLRIQKKKEVVSDKKKKGRPKKSDDDYEDEEVMETRNKNNKINESINNKKAQKDSVNYSMWKGRMITKLMNLLQEYGCNHWSKFEEIGRTEEELRDATAYLIFKMNGFTKDYPKINKVFSKEIKNKTYLKIEGRICSLDYHFSKIDIPSFLEKLEITTAIGEMKPRSPNDIKLKNLKLLNDKEWTKENNQNLLYTIYENGLSAAKKYKYFDKNKSLENRIKILLGIKGNIEVKQSISSEDHENIVLNLQNYGFTTIEEFQDHSNLFHLNLETIQNYIDLIYEYCSPETTNDHRKELQSSFKFQISKYGYKKIFERKKLFETIREKSVSLNEFSAEDLEFLTAASFHGFIHYESSPTLQIAFPGECRETKVYQRIKLILSEQNQKKQVVCSNDILESLPFRLDSMHMLINFGTISNKEGYSDELYIYPIGYKCSCLCISPFIKDTKIWVNAEVLEGKDKPIFKISSEDSSFTYEGSTPSEPFQLLRNDAMNNLKIFIPPFYGVEMYGFLTPYFHQIVLTQPKLPLKYQRRFFKLPFMLNQEWPLILDYSKKHEIKVTHPKEPAPKVVLPPKTNKYPKKIFGTIVPPLVLSFSPLINDESSKSTINIISPKETDISTFISRFSEWDSDSIQSMISRNTR